MIPRRAVQTWINRVRIEIESARPVQIDLDALLDPPPVYAVRVAIECMMVISNALSEFSAETDVIVTVPLPDSEVLDRTYPDLGALVETRWPYGPGLEVPGLYVVPSRLWRTYESIEEYRHPMDPEDVLQDGFAAYYRTWRSTHEAQRGWGYSRAAYIRSV